MGENMASRHRTAITLALTLLMLIGSGCNSFEAFNQSLTGTDQASLISRGKIALDEGRFADALELYERAAVQGSATDEIRRGLASSRAGIAQFNMFKALQTMQNGVTPGDSPAVIFQAASYVKDKDLIKLAIDDLWRLSLPTAQDRLMRGLLVGIYQAKLLVDKYDTNFNGRLDKNDQIDFDTRDDKAALWAAIYNDLISLTSYYSLELAYYDLAQAFDGRGEDWVLISPVQGSRFEGNFTAANRQTVIAIGNLTDSLEAAQVYFNNSEALFKQTMVNLDGSE
ncbi:MAG: hypothetical protein AB1403_12615 [Candidatus Riflebacteria bacterium]